MTLLTADNVHKTYRLGRLDVPVLRGVDMTVNDGEWIAILGSSGSGKSTLLHILGALDRPNTRKGTVQYHGRNVHTMSAGSQNVYRNQSVGFVFQFYHLLPEMNILENTSLAAMVRYGRFGYRRRRSMILKRTRELLESFGLGERLKHKPAELSGGERQRVAIARALMNEPELLLADEPTGNLDAETGRQILNVIKKTHQSGQTIVMVTHDKAIAEYADRVVYLESGRLK